MARSRLELSENSADRVALFLYNNFLLLNGQKLFDHSRPELFDFRHSKVQNETVLELAGKLLSRHEIHVFFKVLVNKLFRANPSFRIYN